MLTNVQAAIVTQMAQYRAVPANWLSIARLIDGLVNLFRSIMKIANLIHENPMRFIKNATLVNKVRENLTMADLHVAQAKSFTSEFSYRSQRKTFYLR